MLKKLHNNLKMQEKLLATTRSLLPVPLDQHCISVQHQHNRLIIHTDSSAWASRLRYFSRDLQKKLLGTGVQIQKIEVRVLINNQQKPFSTRRAHQLSQDNAKLIESAADDIQDLELRAALKRLSKHGTT